MEYTLSWETNTWTGSGAGRFNEDYALVAPTRACAVLVDGATGLTKVNLVAGESDAAWYARSLAQHLAARLGDTSVSTIQALEEGGRATAEAYRLFPGAPALERIDEPNGSVALLRWTDTLLEVTMLGDCTAVVTLTDGSQHVIYDDTLSKLDDQNYERMYAYATAHGTTMAEARRALNPRFIENRLKMNEPGGYWAADISCRGFAHASTVTFPLELVQAAFLCTDGYASATTMEVCSSFEALAARVAAGEGALVGSELRRAEQDDAGCWRHHRSKTSDDATYLQVVFERCARDA